MERAINTGTNSDHLYFTDRIFLDDQMGITFQDQILRFGGYGPRFESKKNCVEGPNHHCGVRYLLNNLNLTDGANRVYRAKLRINGRGGSTELELCRLPNAPDALYVNLVKSTVTTTFKDNSANGRAFYSKIDPQAGSFLAHFDVSAAGFEEVFDPQLGCGPGFSDYIGSK